MGRKMNNMPIKKKKNKDKSNLQIRGRPGLGKTRAKARRQKLKERSREILRMEKGLPVKEVNEEENMSWVERAKAQEEAIAKRMDSQSDDQPKAKKRKKTQDSGPPPPMERNHFQKDQGTKRTVEFDSESDDDAETKSAQFTAEAAEGGKSAENNKAPGTETSRSQLNGEGKVFSEGVSVRVCGLQGAKELNGKVGVCREWDTERQRWQVSLEGGGAEKAIRPENLVLALRTGCLVRVAGLTACPELNGKVGMCINWDEQRKRWEMRVDGELKALRLVNLRGHASQEIPSVSPSIHQVVEVCENSEKQERLVKFIKNINEEERKGKRQRSLFIIYCGCSASQAAVVWVLKKNQFACLSLDPLKPVKPVLSHFNLDEKRFLVVVDEAMKQVPKIEQEIQHVISFDLPNDMETYYGRLKLLDKSIEGPAALTYYDSSKVHLAVPLVNFLRSMCVAVDPALEKIVKAKEAPKTATTNHQSKRASRKERKRKAQEKAVDGIAEETKQNEDYPKGSDGADAGALCGDCKS